MPSDRSDRVDLVTALERAGENSEMVVIVGIRGDKRMANDGVLSVFGGSFGDRSYAGMRSAIEKK
jgi:hypothetical protein